MSQPLGPAPSSQGAGTARQCAGPADRVDEHIAVIGLGYVGLPVALALSGVARQVSGFDIRRDRIAELAEGIDSTGEADAGALCSALAGGRFSLGADPSALAGASVFIITVPTPVDLAKTPDMTVLLTACDMVGRQLQAGALVIIESTVHPGATEEQCVPRLEAASGLRYGRDFAIGYSPERINPGDKANSFRTIRKVVSASDPAALARVVRIYGAVVEAGLHVAPSIKVAEAAKMLENTQRDVNIALMNEVAMIFDRLGIRTAEVLAAARTKWNFLPFEPGLVGGHCIGVDPYYLAYKAREEGAVADLILTSRRINEMIPGFVVDKTLTLLAERGVAAKGARIGVLGLCFKADVPDIRNSLSPRIAHGLRDRGAEVLCHDPVAEPGEMAREYGLALLPPEQLDRLDALVLAVPHRAFRSEGGGLYDRLHRPGVMIDVKTVLADHPVPDGICYWSL